MRNATSYSITIMLLLSFSIFGQINAKTNNKSENKSTSVQGCNPVLSLGGQTGKVTLSKKEIEELKALAIKSDCSDSYTILSYEFTIKIKGQPVSYTTKGPTLDKNMIDALASMKEGSRAFFDNVKIRTPDGKIKIIPGITVTIK